MILAIDVGNSNIVLGVYNGEELLDSWKMTTYNSRTSDELGMFIANLCESSGIKPSDMESAIVASVVPDIMFSLVHGIQKFFRVDPMIVSPDMNMDIKLNMENPAEMGTDRIANMVAAHKLYGGPSIVIEYGTATTFDVCDENGVFVTGVTSAGINTCSQALYKKAAQLPRIEIKYPGTVVARNTISSIQAGLVLGHVGEAKYIINTLKKETNMPNMKVIATGGLAQIINDEGLFDILDSQLTLKGLRILYEDNKDSGIVKMQN